ncbi:MAG: hypothetical protein HY727_17815 [Candidatus Rokubacteria bacterium]|nr:hypothetical protein [Candidatus Rokubacteria bacterium]
MSTNRLVTTLLLSSATTLLAISSWDGAAAAARPGTPPTHHRYEPAVDRQVETARIVAVLERNIADPRVVRKAASKLATLSDRQRRLIASLSERMAADDEGPAPGIALLLITALLTLS